MVVHWGISVGRATYGDPLKTAIQAGLPLGRIFAWLIFGARRPLQ